MYRCDLLRVYLASEENQSLDSLLATSLITRGHIGRSASNGGSVGFTGVDYRVQICSRFWLIGRARSFQHNVKHIDWSTSGNSLAFALQYAHNAYVIGHYLRPSFSNSSRVTRMNNESSFGSEWNSMERSFWPDRNSNVLMAHWNKFLSRRQFFFFFFSRCRNFYPRPLCPLVFYCRAAKIHFYDLVVSARLDFLLLPAAFHTIKQLRKPINPPRFFNWSTVMHRFR